MTTIIDHSEPPPSKPQQEFCAYLVQTLLCLLLTLTSVVVFEVAQRGITVPERSLNPHVQTPSQYHAAAPDSDVELD